MNSFQSESRNIKNILRQKEKAFNSTKIVNAIALQQKRKLSGINLNSKEKYLKRSTSKINLVGAYRNSISFGSNTTNVASPSVNINASISKIDSSKKNINFSNNGKNALL